MTAAHQQSDSERIRAMIEGRDTASRRRIFVMAGLMRELCTNAGDAGEQLEAQLALTLVLAELSEAP